MEEKIEDLAFRILCKTKKDPNYDPSKMTEKELKEIERLESIISESPEYCWFYSIGAYCDNKIKRFILGEPTIAKHPFWALMYAIDVLNGPFEACEQYIVGSPYEGQYMLCKENFLKGKPFCEFKWRRAPEE